MSDNTEHACDGPKGHDYKQVNTFRVNGGPMYQTFRCDPCGGRYTSLVAGPTIPAPEPVGTITATLPDWYLNGEVPEWRLTGDSSE